MESTLRTVVKGVSWQILGVLTMTVLSYPYTDSLVAALSIATSSALTGFIFFFIHEKVWNRVGWGRRPPGP